MGGGEMYIVQLHFWEALGSLNSLWHRLSEKKVSFLAPKDLSRAGLQPKKTGSGQKKSGFGRFRQNKSSAPQHCLIGYLHHRSEIHLRRNGPIVLLLTANSLWYRHSHREPAASVESNLSTIDDFMLLLCIF